MSDELTNRIAELIEASRHSYDLRYSSYCEEWVLMASSGNIMVVVPGTMASTAIESVRLGMDKWKNRSIDKPFIHCYSQDG